MDMLYLTIAIGTWIDYVENGSYEGESFKSVLEQAWYDWRPIYTCHDITSRSYITNRMIKRVLEDSYRLHVEQQLQAPLLFRTRGGN